MKSLFESFRETTLLQRLKGVIMYRILGKVYTLLEENAESIISLLVGKSCTIFSSDTSEGMLEKKFRVLTWARIEFVRPNVSCDTSSSTTLFTVYTNDPLYNQFIVNAFSIDAKKVTLLGSAKDRENKHANSFLTLEVERI